ncbi:hypothetical protein [Plantactinospora endophytica]|uniref:Uncharacterized protein n=1 Tax=Plantactinospora endophytica TaxID=673535 RepID=A0ABQ4DVZ7_9ACTN|nr:hypothetical protein [Plantactinospora endophytica]GIG86625.1 hypothetical protein Pen02_15610 [Plantactinospora endophytica]
MGAWRRRTALLAAFLVTGVATSACGGDDDVQPTVTAVQAAQRVEEILRETHSQLPPGAELKPFGNSGTLPCDDPTDGGPAGRVFVEQQYEVVFPGNWPADQALPKLAEYWQQQDYKIVNDLRDRSDPRLSVEDPADGYRVSITVYNRAPGSVDIYLIGSSPCVWQNGTPDPQ